MFPLYVHLKAKVDVLPFTLGYKEDYPWHKYIDSLRYGALTNDLFFFTKSMFAFQVEKPGGLFGPANPFFLEPHECHCPALFMRPPPSSLDLCFMIS